MKEVECPFFIHSKQILFPVTFGVNRLQSYVIPTDGKEAKPALRMTPQLMQFLHEATATLFYLWGHEESI